MSIRNKQIRLTFTKEDGTKQVLSISQEAKNHIFSPKGFEGTELGRRESSEKSKIKIWKNLPDDVKVNSHARELASDFHAKQVDIMFV